MKPLKVVLVHLDNPRFLDGRMVGMWSYDVPEFQVCHYAQADKYAKLDRDMLGRVYDVIVEEDHQCRATFSGTARIPLCYQVGDSTLSAEHYHARREMAAKADMVLVDWDQLSHYRPAPGGRVIRCSYAVNDKLFQDYGLPKDIDVGFYCHRSEPGKAERAELVVELREFCQRRGYSFDSKIRPGIDYAHALNRTRLVVQVRRNHRTRAHRTFDAMACRACLVTDHLPDVSGEIRTPGEHYVEYQDWDSLTATIDRLLSTGDWQRYADAGYELAQREHTWAKRATYLHGQLCEAFPWLKD